MTDVGEKLDKKLHNALSYLVFWNALLKTGLPPANSVFGINGAQGVRLLTRLVVDLTHLNDHRFSHNFQNCINPICSFSLEVVSTIHFLLNVKTIKKFYGNIASLSLKLN